MPRINRHKQKVFGGNSNSNGQFGSARAGSKLKSNDISVLQGLPAWEQGWADATITGQNLPTMEEMQAVDYVHSNQIAYLLQEGMAEYDPDTTYYLHSMVKKPGTRDLYVSVSLSNTGQDLDDPAKWRYIGDLSLMQGLLDPAVINLVDNPEFNLEWDVDVADVVQDIINSRPAGSRVILNYPSTLVDRPIIQSDVSTNGRSVSFRGKGSLGTFIQPPTTFTRSPFRLNYAYASIEGMTINDRSNTWGKPGFLIDRNNTTQSLVLLGEGGNTSAIKMLVDDVQVSNSRGQGVRYEGGPISAFNRMGITASCAGGFQSTNQGGDTNHWKMLDVTLTRNFGFGMWFEAGNNGGGAGVFVDTKIYQSENWNLRLDGNANSGSIFLEMSNGWSGNGNTTRTAGSPVLKVIRDATSSLEPGMYMDNPVARGFPLGTFITAVNKDTGDVTMNLNAVSSGTTDATAFYSNRGMRKPSIWVGPNAYGNQLHIMGDALDPECWRDDSAPGANHLTYAYGGSQFTNDTPVKKLRIFGGERNTQDPNGGFYFTTYATFTAGSPTVVLSDPTVLNRTKYGATISSPGGLTGNTTLLSANTDTGVLTLNANATGSGLFLLIVRPNQRGGYLVRMLDDNTASFAVTGANTSQTMHWTSRSSLYVGITKAGSPVISRLMKLDNESQTFGNNTPFISLDTSIFPTNSKVVSFTTNSDGTFEVTMDKNAILDRTGVTFLATNTVGIRHVMHSTRSSAGNAAALAGGYFIGEMYRTTVGGDMRMVVDAETDGRYRFVVDPPSVAAGATVLIGSFNGADSDGKAFVSMAIGDFCRVEASRNLLGCRAFFQPTGTNAGDLYLQNGTAVAQDFASTSFFLQHEPR